jgi:serine/threonine-protein kinase PknG
MPEHSETAEQPLPLPHPWANRRMRGTEVPRRVAHPWSTRRAASPDARPLYPVFSERFSTQSGQLRPVRPVTRRQEDRELELLSEDDSFATEADPGAGTGRGSGRTGRSRPSVRRLGAGLVEMPKVTPLDPRTAVLTNPEVPEVKRFCWKCDAPVGRRSAAGPGVISGTCAACSSPFNFRPSLQPGELVAGQYEVQGCLAHGGLGWVYLAVDRNVSDRWVVLKGLQNPMDFEAHVVALAERQFLSEMAYPGIVKIHNFVKHAAAGREAAAGYIVMEYVGGRSLKKMLDVAAPGHIPVVEAIAYLMEVLPALDYLHSFGLAYNDLKPDNIMVSEDEVKLIDLGAVAALDSYGSIYGTPGYQAPEITETGPTVASDLYSVGRTLAALTLRMPIGPDGNLAPGVPSPRDQPLLRRYPTLYRLLCRATDPDPRRRFPSAYAMYCQMVGVLRMVLAVDTGYEHPQASSEFGAMRDDFGIGTLIGQTDGVIDGTHRMPEMAVREVVATLPFPLIDTEDPSAELLSTMEHGDPVHVLDALRRTRARIAAGVITEPETFELEGTLAAVRAHLELEDVAAVRALIAGLGPGHDGDWRIEWYLGIAALLDGEFDCGYQHFDVVHSMLPGEIAPPLALGAAAELVLQHLCEPGDLTAWHDAAMEHYRTVWCTNHGVVSAAFGLARRLAADGDLLAAVAILDEVPAASRHHGMSRMTGSLLLVSRPTAEITEADLAAADSRLALLTDDPRFLQLKVIVVGAALEWLRAGAQPRQLERILGFPVTPKGLRQGLESSLRALAHIAPDRWRRYRLIDLANRVRPRSWL